MDLSPRLERVTREIATHKTTCGGSLTVTERTMRPFEDATIALTCATCGARFRARITVTDFGDHADIERAFETFTQRAIN